MIVIMGAILTLFWVYAAYSYGKVSGRIEGRNEVYDLYEKEIYDLESRLYEDIKRNVEIRLMKEGLEVEIQGVKYGQK